MSNTSQMTRPDPQHSEARSTSSERTLRGYHQVESTRASSSVDAYSASLASSESQLAGLDAALVQFRRAVLQRRGSDSLDTHDVHATAAAGVQGSGSQLPHLDRIQAAFGRHDVQGVRAHQGAQAHVATQQLGARAYARGNDVVLGHEGGDLHTVAHEAAHVIQQRAGVALKDGMGQVGDVYEQHADAVADAVVAGRSAEGLLDQMAPSGTVGGSSAAVQRQDKPITATYGEQVDMRKPYDPTKVPRQGGVHQMGANNLRLYAFDQGSAQLKSDHVTAIDALIRRLERHYGPPDDARWWRHVFRIEGSSSPEGSERANQQLSNLRAYEVVSQMHAARNVGAEGGAHLDQVSVSIGETGAPDADEQTWSLHRRVDLRVSIQPEEERASEDDAPAHETTDDTGEDHDVGFGAVIDDEKGLVGGLGIPNPPAWLTMLGKGGVGIVNALATSAASAGSVLLLQVLFAKAALDALAKAHESSYWSAIAMGKAYGKVCVATGRPAPKAPGDIKGEDEEAFTWDCGHAIWQGERDLKSATHEVLAVGLEAASPQSRDIVVAYYAMAKKPEQSLNSIYQQMVDKYLSGAVNVAKVLAQGRRLTWPEPSEYKRRGDER